MEYQNGENGLNHPPAIALPFGGAGTSHQMAAVSVLDKVTVSRFPGGRASVI